MEDLLIEVAHHGQVVLESDLAERIILGFEERFFPGVAHAAGLFNRRTVVSQLMGVDASQQFGAAPDKEDALAQQGTQGSFIGGINVSRRNEIRAKQVGEFFGIDAVVLVFPAVDGFDVESVSQNEGQAGSLAGVGQPVPAEHAFAANCEVMLIGLDELEEEGEVVVPDIGVNQFLALAVHDADIHLASVQVDSAVVFGR